MTLFMALKDEILSLICHLGEKTGRIHSNPAPTGPAVARLVIRHRLH